MMLLYLAGMLIILYFMYLLLIFCARLLGDIAIIKNGHRWSFWFAGGPDDRPYPDDILNNNPDLSNPDSDDMN